MRNFRQATQSLWEHRSRSFLSALGITVAAIAIVLLVSIALGVQKDIRSQVEDLGVNTLVVLPGKVGLGTFNPNIGGQSYLKEEHLATLRKVPGAIRACPMTFVGGGIEANGKFASPFIVATTSDWFQMRPVRMLFGDVYHDPLSKERVAVIGSLARRELFGETGNPVGKTVTINGLNFRVIGVTIDKEQEQSLFSMGSLQNVVYIPYHAQKALAPDSQTDRLMVQCDPEADPKTLVPGLNAAMGSLLTDVQYSILTQEDLLNLVFKVMSILTWLLVGLTSIGLFVGGIGIFAIMMMSVGERSHEIGIRKTVGAKQRDVFVQFLTESGLLALLGGTVGLLFSVGACALIRTYTPIKPEITPAVIGLCFGTCLAVGVLAGLLPALRAARKDPIAAMRAD